MAAEKRGVSIKLLPMNRSIVEMHGCTSVSISMALAKIYSSSISNLLKILSLA